MRRDPRAYLWDAARAAEHVALFVHGKTFEDYQTDVLLRSGVERQLEIVGEALNQLARLDAELAVRIPELASVVGFRNVLVHGYATVDDARVWSIVEQHLPTLRAAVDALLEELDG